MNELGSRRSGEKHGQPPVADVLSVLRSTETNNVRMKRTCDD